jgi:hypothetical protein
MKSTELPMVQEEKISRMSKPRRQGDLVGASKRQSSPARMAPIPIEWLDPDCWRLPSGKALAEFALQAGFLAPLMLGLPRPKPNSGKRTGASSVEGLENGLDSRTSEGTEKRPSAGSGKRI